MKTTEQHLEQSQLQHKIEIAKDEKILDQLKLLTEAVNKIQPPSPSLDQSQVKNMVDFVSNSPVKIALKSTFFNSLTFVTPLNAPKCIHLTG